MAWDFETDPEYQEKLDWADEFVREEVEPLDLLFPHQQVVPGRLGPWKLEIDQRFGVIDRERTRESDGVHERISGSG